MRSPKHFHYFRLFWLFGLACPLWAQLEPKLDKTNGEEEQILARETWFYQQRQLYDIARPDLLRATAAGQTENMAAAEALRGDRPAWTPLGPSPMVMLDWSMGNVSGRVSAIAIHPQNREIIYLGAAAGGLWKSVNGGLSWQALFDREGTQSIGAIVLDPKNPNTLWVGTGEHAQGCSGYFGRGLYKSEDGGATFFQVNGDAAGPLNLSYISAIALHPDNPDILLAGGHAWCANGQQHGGGLFFSSNGGAGWRRILEGPVNDILADPKHPGTFYTAIGRDHADHNGIFKSTDHGLNWERLNTGLPVPQEMGRSRIALSPSHPDILYAVINTDQQGTKLFRSTDGGKIWELRRNDVCEGQCDYNLCLSVHPTDPNRILLGSIRFARSNDGGLNLGILTSGWGHSQAVHQDTHVLVYDPQDGERFWIGTDGGIWRAEQNGNIFTNLNGNLNITQIYDIAVHPHDPSLIFAGAQDNSSQFTRGFSLWDVTLVTGDGFTNAVDPLNPNVVIQSSYPQGTPNLYRSLSGGLPGTFGYLPPTGLSSLEPWPWVTPMAVTANGERTTTALFIASNRVYLSQNLGDSWSPLSDDPLCPESLQTLAATPLQDSLVVYAGSSLGRLFRTDDALSPVPIWLDITGNYAGGAVTDIAIDRLDPYNVFITNGAFDGARIFGSNEGGGQWIPLGANLPDIPANTLALDPFNAERIFLGTDVGIFESEDGGAFFSTLMVDFPMGTVVTDLEIDADPHVLTAATFGRGVWQARLEDREIQVEVGPDHFVCNSQLIPLNAEVSFGLPPHVWRWRVVSGPNLAGSQFSATQIATPVFTPSAPGIYLLEVTVEDALFHSASETIGIAVFDNQGILNQGISRWALRQNHPNWQALLDRDHNGVIQIIDLVRHQALPTCP